jgi:uncharacterized membrane protein YqaE (UPF0057 family)
MKKFFKYFLTILMPWLSMIIIEENVAAIITFFLQLSLIGWIPGAIWACSLLKKNLAAEEKAKATSNPNTNTTVNKDHG